ncbi:hypothetical protein MRB53_013149 [Persea americana]|uniref:Uncharacterized protein n=1 Tax=Persea americana TaxID=3435 RepID=A0ACC2K7R8_PERAE|nr:hypothetical protein MRB53_013149 [Persea americana]|eukprot:TRINITY_DN14262_c0_g1_i1.p1 TRINITY_DN14262_c0_g1~~TRINITY_DN14262_c0_g1_i1.p1  ORF type:complete len:241 (+),score=17.14 TRINITY_DN14262_c0_g1_i1:138-860(+)
MKKKPRVCELCSAEAALYCASDAAYLCWSCDAGVHKANFLVARHVRRTLCVRCGKFDGRLLSGAALRPIRPLCRGCCSPKISDPCKSSPSSCSSSLSCSSDCVWSTEKTGGRVRFRTGPSEPDYARAEGILVIWGRRLGLRSRRGWLALALRAVAACVRRFPVLPMRVRLACSLWLAGNACEPRGLSTWQLSRLEECSRVPRKLIRLGEAKLARAVRVRDDDDDDDEEEEEEEWAECSDG